MSTEGHPSDPRERLEAIAAGCSGDFGFYARDLRTGRTIARRAEESFPTASLIKVAILVELERQAVEGSLTMSQALTLRDETGSLTGVRTHAGVLWSDETPLRIAMCGMVSGSTDPRWSVDADALVAIGKAGRVAYEALSAP